MTTFTLVTGNPHKLEEFQRLLPADLAFDSVSLDLDEIQSLDPLAITEHKVRQAYTHVGKPVVVEDVSAGLDALQGLPGPFIKFFEQALGKDALYKLVNGDNAATVTCTIVYYDGKTMVTAQGVVHGEVVPLRPGQGFGFDNVFVPAGQTKTFSEMAPHEKDKLSHRFLAVKNLLEQLKQL